MDVKFSKALRVRLLKGQSAILLSFPFTYLQREYVIREDDDFISSFFMIFDKELTGLELVRVHTI